MTDDHALVLGGSMAGLLAARMLADAYGQVTVLDRDDLTVAAAPRRGAPQARHIHALLARGQQALEQLFPGLTAELESRGAPVGDMLGDARVLFGGHRLARADAGLPLVSVSRPLLEERVRARVRALPQVRFAPPGDVVALRSSPDRRRVTGVRVLRRADGSADEAVDADLVVDATGRGSRAPRWLEALGHERPEQEEVRIDVGYATRRYRLPSGALDGDLACVHGPTPDQPRGGALARLEDEIWMLTLFGLLGDHPPRDPDGFAAFARSLRFPDLFDAIADAEPIDDPVGYRFTADVRRRYERARGLPEGFLVMGDALCSFNPIYGQGMTAAALQALALRDHLPLGRNGTQAAIRALARAADAPWQLAVGADLAVPQVEGRRSPSIRLVNRYVSRLHAAAAHDSALSRAFLRVTGLVDRPEALLRPSVARRVLRARSMRSSVD
jgi:2-polyprenyl-6-methoxyphenol hydroxylase-like FAD-dependent oxidoreductase